MLLIHSFRSLVVHSNGYANRNAKFGYFKGLLERVYRTEDEWMKIQFSDKQISGMYHPAIFEMLQPFLGKEVILPLYIPSKDKLYIATNPELYTLDKQ